ncbi:acetyl-CoA C-acyltransferase, partial [Klebsiella pneumoniae]|nr:acetyl-CoA C-acyltransferase [Klebsiella pneumoniae]
ARLGLRMGDGSVKDLMIMDGLTCSCTGAHMGSYGNAAAKELQITREEQDRWALRSHMRAVRAAASGSLGEEIVPVKIPQQRGGELTVDQDEAPRRDTSFERLSMLAPVFDHDGAITAGNAPGVLSLIH